MTSAWLPLLPARPGAASEGFFGVPSRSVWRARKTGRPHKSGGPRNDSGALRLSNAATGQRAAVAARLQRLSPRSASLTSFLCSTESRSASAFLTFASALSLVDLVADAVGGVFPRVLDLATSSLSGVLRVFTESHGVLLSRRVRPCPGGESTLRRGAFDTARACIVAGPLLVVRDSTSCDSRRR